MKHIRLVAARDRPSRVELNLGAVALDLWVDNGRPTQLDVETAPGLVVETRRDEPLDGPASDWVVAFYNSDSRLNLAIYAGTRKFLEVTVRTDSAAPLARAHLDGFELVDCSFESERAVLSLIRGARLPQREGRIPAVFVTQNATDHSAARHLARCFPAIDPVLIRVDEENRIQGVEWTEDRGIRFGGAADLDPIADRWANTSHEKVLLLDLWRVDTHLGQIRRTLGDAIKSVSTYAEQVDGSLVVCALANPIFVSRPFVLGADGIGLQNALYNLSDVELKFQIDYDVVEERDRWLLSRAAEDVRQSLYKRRDLLPLPPGHPPGEESERVFCGSPTPVAYCYIGVAGDADEGAGDAEALFRSLISEAAAAHAERGSRRADIFDHLQRQLSRPLASAIVLDLHERAGGNVRRVVAQFGREAAKRLIDAWLVLDGMDHVDALIGDLDLKLRALDDGVLWLTVRSRADYFMDPDALDRDGAGDETKLALSIDDGLTPEALTPLARLIGELKRPEASGIDEVAIEWLSRVAKRWPELGLALLQPVLRQSTNAKLRSHLESVIASLAASLPNHLLGRLIKTASVGRMAYAAEAQARKAFDLAPEDVSSIFWLTFENSYSPDVMEERLRTFPRLSPALRETLSFFNWMRTPGKPAALPDFIAANAIDKLHRETRKRFTALSLLLAERDIDRTLTLLDGVSLSEEEAAVWDGMRAATLGWLPGEREFITQRILQSRQHDYAPLRDTTRTYEKLQDFREPPCDPHDVVCVITARDEALRLPHVIAHHKRLGVRHFVLIDNMSTDRTVGIMAAENARIYRTRERYSESRFGMAWVNDILERDLADRWVLVIDADEMFVYPEMETRPISGLVRDLDASGYEGLQALLVDMYPAEPLASVSVDEATDLRALYCWHDAGNHQFDPAISSPLLTAWGGVRDRLFRFAANADLAPIALNKAPLVHWRRGMKFLSSTHALTPLRLPPYLAVLEHYKYTPDFVVRARREAIRKEHWSGASEYLAYARVLEQSPDLSFIGPMSCRRERSTDIVEKVSPFRWPSSGAGGGSGPAGR